MLFAVVEAVARRRSIEFAATMAGLAISVLVITGGVACNRGLRALAQARCSALGIELHVPPPRACTDNAAMIAYAGACRLVRGENDGLDFPVFSRSPILGARAGSPALRRYRSQRLPR